jgi:hypothetical protein
MSDYRSIAMHGATNTWPGPNAGSVFRLVRERSVACGVPEVFDLTAQWPIDRSTPVHLSLSRSSRVNT